MEEQRVLARGEGFCWRRRQRKAKIQKKRQSFVLWKKNVEEGQVYRRTSSSDWTGQKEKSCDEICQATFAT